MRVLRTLDSVEAEHVQRVLEQTGAGIGVKSPGGSRKRDRPE
jgi:hypothetical protein